MFEQTRNLIGAAFIAASVTVTPMAGASALAAPDAQRQEGLVNVALVDVASHDNIGVLANVPVGVAANVCGVNVAAILAAAGGTAPVCTAQVTQQQANQLMQDNRTSNPNRGGQGGQQQGLVNVALVDIASHDNIGVLANVPVAAAANLCGIDVAAVLAAAGGTAPACTAQVTQAQANELQQQYRNRGQANR